MPGLRLLLRSAPWIVAALAAAIWLRRRAADRPLLEPAKRFERAPIDIVTVVDDLLEAGRA